MLGQAPAQTMVEQNVGQRLFSGPYPLSTFIYQGKKVILRPLRNPIYDTETIPAGAITNRTYFTRPLGNADAAAAIAAKTVSETNLTQNGQLSAPDTFALFGFNYVVQYGITLADYRLVYNTSAFTFTFTGNRVYLEIPLNRIPCGVGSDGLLCCDGATAAVTQQEVHNGEGHITNLYPFAIEKRTLWIQPNENFGARVDWLAAITLGVANRSQVFLLGMLYKAI